MTEKPEQPRDGASGSADGIPARDLSLAGLLAEIRALHHTRYDTLRYGSSRELRTHLARTGELEREYLRRFPDREVDPARTR
jgi:hypothetical protein